MLEAMRDKEILPPEKAAISNIIGLGLSEAMAALLPDENAQTREAVVERYRYHFLHPDTLDSEPFNSVLETLQALSDAGYLLAVATGKSRRGLERAMQSTGLGSLFVASRCADETFSKPHPRMLEEILDLTGCYASEAVMIGDTTYDLEMAANVRMDSIAVSYGVHDRVRLMALGPRACIDQINELPACLAGLG
jgi:phosphoglycolate phosphatase